MSHLELSGLSKSYGNAAVVRAIDLEIRSGEFFALLGPSGCGKTTLLRLIAGFERPDAGKIFLDGIDITGQRPQEREIGMVFQSYALFPHMTVFENVAFGLRARRVAQNEIVQRVHEALSGVSLSGKGGRPVAELSGGEQQRVAVARSLVLRPRLLLFDEPLSNLDAALRVATREEIRTLQRAAGVTAVYVTHDQAEAMSLADRVAVMRSGSFVQVGTPDELYDHPADPFVAEFLGGANLIAGSVRGGEFTAGTMILSLPRGFGAGADTEALLAVKPEAIRVTGPAENENVRAIIAAREYLGFTTSLRLDVGGNQLKALAVSAHLPGGLTVGMSVGISFDWSRCTLFPDAR
ncbi:MAG: ABC transporter ATP-binding protein [Bacteroidota bacterium]